MRDAHLKDKVRIYDILGFIADIEGMQNKEPRDKTLIWAMTYLILVIGEACRAISDDLKKAYPEVPWRRINGMRNRLVHEYSKVDEAYLWEVVSMDLPELKKQMKAIFDERFPN